MKHYATIYKERIRFLENCIAKYYDVVYDAQMMIKDRHGLTGTPIHSGRPRMMGHETHPHLETYEEVCKLVENLPLMDCGV